MEQNNKIHLTPTKHGHCKEDENGLDYLQNIDKFTRAD